MKKIIFLSLLFFGITMNGYSQVGIGAGLGIYDGFTSALVNAEIPLSDSFSISPSVEHSLAKYSDAFLFNLDAQYNFGDKDALNFYPLAGVVVVTDFKRDATLFDVGGGLNYAISDNIKLLGEAKYLITEEKIGHSRGGTYTIQFGVLFNL